MRFPLRFAAAFAAFLLIAAPPAAAAPIVQWFSGAPATVKQGSSTQLQWHVDGAQTVEISPGIGAVAAAGNLAVSPAVTTTYTLTARSGGDEVQRSETIVVGPNATVTGGRFVRLVAPIGSQEFAAPGTLRFFAAAYDPGAGNERRASSVEFFVDDTVVAQVPAAQAEYWVFQATAEGIAAGTHRVWARAHYTAPAATLDSESAWIRVIDVPAAQTIALTQDVVLSGAQNYEVSGAPGARIRLDGNGFRIRSSDNWSGRLTLRHVDVTDLGPRNSSVPAIEIATSNGVTLEDSTFETTGILDIALGNQAQASILRNEFRSNMTMKLSQQPEFEPDASYPALRISGGTAATARRFAGNRVGAGWVDFYNTSNWLVGGDTPADANVVMGARTGIWIRNSDAMRLRGNFIWHVYYGGWSQGNVVELGGSDDVIVEHNVIGGGSWPIRGLGGTLRYNLVLEAGHEWLWITGDGARVHHNVFVGGDGDQAPFRIIYGPAQVLIHNNTLDGLGASSMRRPIWVQDDGEAELHSNAIVGMPNAPHVQIDGTLVADHNLFHGQGANPRNYSDNRWPAHDVGAPNAQTPPGFAEAAIPLRHRRDDLWAGRLDVRQMLADYRQRYTPGAGSALIGAGQAAAGDPARILRSGFESGEGAPGVAGSDIGAVQTHPNDPADLFGK